MHAQMSLPVWLVACKHTHVFNQSLKHACGHARLHEPPSEAYAEAAPY